MAEAACISIDSPDAVWLRNGERIATQRAVLADPKVPAPAKVLYQALALHCLGSTQYRIGAPELGKECGIGRTKSYAHMAVLIERRYVERRGEMLAIVPRSCRSQVKVSPESRTAVRNPGLTDLMEGARAVLDRKEVDDASTQSGQRCPHRADSPIVDRARGPEERNYRETTTTRPGPVEVPALAADPEPEAEMVRSVTALRIPMTVARELIASAQAKIGKEGLRNLWAIVTETISKRRKSPNPIGCEAGFARRALESPDRYMVVPPPPKSDTVSDSPPRSMSTCARCKEFFDAVLEGWDGSGCCLGCRETLERDKPDCQ